MLGFPGEKRRIPSIPQVTACRADGQVLSVMPNHLRLDVGVSKNRGTPKWMVKIMEISLKWMIWGYPYFWKHPCFCIFCSSEDAWFDVVDSISCWEPALSFGKVFAMLHEETWCNQTGCGWKSHGSSLHKPHKSWIWANHLRWWFRLLSKGIPQKLPLIQV